MTLLPLIEAPAADLAENSPTSKLYREVEWDLSKNRPVWVRGRPKWVTGARAVASWIANVLYTERYSRDIFSSDYGLELRALAGKPFTAAVKQSEALRYVRECLEINPYITDVRQINVELTDSMLSIECAVSTIYGEVRVNVSRS